VRAGRAASLAATGLVVLLAGCGSRTPAPQLLRPAAPGGFQLNSYGEAGVRLAVPRHWTTVTVHLPLVALIASGPAVISLWRYPRTGAQPSTPAQLQQALRRLIAAARSRDPTLRVLGSSTTAVGGLPAAEVETVQRIGTAVRQVHSTHVYGPGEEVVLEEYSPVGLFPRLDRTVFSSVRSSLAPLKR
jgi:hypothetical protein